MTSINLCLISEGCADQFCAMCKQGWFKVPFKGRKCHKQCPAGYYPLGNHFCSSKFNQAFSGYKIDILDNVMITTDPIHMHILLLGNIYGN